TEADGFHDSPRWRVLAHFAPSRPSRPVGARVFPEGPSCALRSDPVGGGTPSAGPRDVPPASTGDAAGWGTRAVPACLWLRTHRRTKKNAGVRKRPNRATPIRPLTPAVPSDWRIPAPAPLATTSG